MREVTIKNKQDKVGIDADLLEKAALLVLCREGKVGELGILVTDDEGIKKMNNKYLSKNAPTDVLAFPMDSDGMIGDVVVSAERAAEQAREYGLSLNCELVRLVIHGVLHLCGYEDSTPKERKTMGGKQEEIVEKALKL